MRRSLPKTEKPPLRRARNREICPQNPASRPTRHSGRHFGAAELLDRGSLSSVV